MKIAKINPKKSLNKAFLKQRPLRSEIELFKSNLIQLLDNIDEIEREENQKNHIRDFLRDTYYKETNEINTKDTKDLVIHLGKTNKDKVGVIIEAKRPGNKIEMLSDSKPNAKALQELVLYFLRERIEENNIDIKYLIATNVYEWYIFDASYFEKLFYRNKSFVKQYEDWRDGLKITKDTSLFYNDIAQPFIENLDEEVKCTHFDIRDYEKILRNENKADDKKLIALQKLLSPFFLLRVPFANDSNSLNEKFYKELLHLIGLEEVKSGTKNIIRRKENYKQAGSLIENTINILITEDSLHKLKDKTVFGKNIDEQLFGVALELSLTWINRILFLKLLEGQLITYHKGNKDYRFLNSEMISDYDELYKLFHQVLARNIDERSSSTKKKYNRIPYLNSSLFEISELEDVTIKINSLDNSETVEFISGTVLKEEKKKSRRLPSLEYLFKFLDAYDFASEGGEDIAEDNKTIISASVLGKVFEKINGYKDGSIFTPGFITMYMARQSLRLAVIQKFNDYFKSHNIQEVNTFEELYNRIDKIDIKTANEIINSLRICDPAVGSGHFLVSCLNEIIVIKSELGILIDKDGKRLRDYEIVVDNDELIISDDNGIFEYNYQNKESQSVQKTIFNERQNIIESCLFGVDINPNSVKICRLRLWIELLKSSYYKAPDYTELETLPNIDINIKCGNSLVSRYALDADLKKALQKSKWNITSYRLAVMTYRNAGSKDEKRAMEKLIDEIKNNFEIEIQFNDKRFKKLHNLKNELSILTKQGLLFDKTAKEKKDWNKKVTELTAALKKQEELIEEIKNNAIYKNAFEWRFEFPEVLNIDGEYEGFDVVLGNPPYIRVQDLQHSLIDYFKDNFKVAHKRIDISILFIELGYNILKRNGHLTYITSNQFIKAEYGRNVRNFLKGYLKVNIDYSKVSVFEGLATYVSVFLITKNRNEKIEYKLIDNVEDNPQDFIRFDVSDLSDEPWDFNVNQSLKQKVFSNKNSLSNISNFTYGVITGLDKAFLIPQEQADDLQLENGITKKFIRPQNYKKYHLFSQTFSLIYPYNKDNTIIKEDEFKSKYPNCYKFLSSFKTDLENRQDSRTTINDKGIAWYSLIRRVDLNDIDIEKIVFYDVGILPNFILDNNKYIFGGGTSHSLRLAAKNYNIKFILGVLNSLLMTWIIYDLCPVKMGNARKYGLNYIKKLPIPKISEKDQQPIIDIVYKVIENKQQGKDTTAFEQQIDQMVYKLYDLTEEEIKIVEGEVNGN